MPLYSAGQVKMESGLLYASTMQLINRVTNVKIDYSVPRVNVAVLNRGKPLEVRPVINYVPVNVSLDMYKSDNSLEQMLGLVNQTGIGALITDTNSLTATYGIRSMQVYYAPTQSANYNGLLDIKSGVLTSYSLQGSVNEAVRQSVALQFLDMSGSVNTNPRDSTNYQSAVVKPENIVLAGLLITGYGFSGAVIQSFSLGVSFSRTSIMKLGQRFPDTRPLTDITASLQIQGFFEGINNSLTGLSQFNNGTPTYGTVQLTLVPASINASPTIITLTNPYLDSFSVDGQVGNFSTFSASYSLPLGPNPLETGDGSVLTIQ